MDADRISMLAALLASRSFGPNLGEKVKKMVVRESIEMAVDIIREAELKAAELRTERDESGRPR